MLIKYPVYQPNLQGNEKKYVTDCIDSTWISSKGKYIELFEKKFAEFIGIPYATSVNNGTTALHLALLSLNILPGDEIIVPTFTYAATANSILYMNAKPVFVDCLRNSWQADPDDIIRKITPKTKAVMTVHLYGQAAEMSRIKKICENHKLLLIEDCAEAIGTRYAGRHVGTFGDIATFSFFGNKTITTGEGGMVVSANQSIIEKARNLKNQGVSQKQYWHDAVGYNYRMTNICAAIGLAQTERIEKIISEKIRIADIYRKEFEKSEIEFHQQQAGTFHSYWMCSFLVKKSEQREPLRNFLNEAGIETRPAFYPVHQMPMYATFKNGDFPVSDDISQRGLNLPSYPDLTDEDVLFISQKVKEFFK
jgi:perosamine synthetase